MSTTTYYRARCGSICRVTHTPARAISKPAHAQPAAAVYTLPLSKDPSGAEYPTTSAEVARLISTGSFTQEATQ